MDERRSSQDMAEELSKLLYGKYDWLSRFSSGREKRPDHDIERMERERDVLTQAASDYRRAAERDRGAA
ncbi:hypothetical protein [Phyllobacterium zundukense]|uniref:Uncharacterized protein n=1 Tax=Phyllobacterium zundukense TaxID=1867719 RepID=A0A2N9VW26_9HYPH|nr:hypothetical protein [Phyllobacterium zundukense]ATU91427.1 hypothetical protein BLM14_07120 [Phyllobacterium zundukense]PIO43694.1 hypothetical protein B5P45_17505 [Phyllobacterium zundukense]